MLGIAGWRPLPREMSTSAFLIPRQEITPLGPARSLRMESRNRTLDSKIKNMEMYQQWPVLLQTTSSPSFYVSF